MSKLLLILVAAMMSAVNADASTYYDECSVRTLALDYSKHLLPHSTGQEAHDALDIAGVCKGRRYAPPRPAAATAATAALANSGDSDAASASVVNVPADAPTLHAAQVLSRAKGGACTVKVAPGTYHLKQTLVLTHEDSGSSWQATGPGVVLSGGVAIPAALWKPAAGAYFEFSGKVMVADVSKLNLSSTVQRLFAAEQPQVWARYPNAPAGLSETALRIPIGTSGSWV